MKPGHSQWSFFISVLVILLLLAGQTLMMKESSTEILVIGAGPAGTLAAAILNKHKKKVRIVEKQTFPRFVIGESLLPVTMEHLEKADLLDAVKKAGFQEKHGVQFIRDGKVCQFNFDEQYTNGWTWTWQLPRADFDKLLADEVEKKGVRIDYNTEVTAVDISSKESVVIVQNGENEERISAKYIIDCSGFGRVLPRLLNLDKPSTLPPKSSFFTHVTDRKRPPGTAGTLITFVVLRQDAWFWIIPFSNGITSVGFVGDPDYFGDITKNSEQEFKNLMDTVPVYNDRFKNEDIVVPPKLIQGYSKSIEKLYGPGYVLCGNSAEFLDPVFSSGVAFATGSGTRAAELIVQELNGNSVDWETDYEKYMRDGVSIFKSFVEGWYNGNLQKVFFNDEINPVIKNQICSLLAGYVWDTSNPVVKRHDKILGLLAKVIDISIKADTTT